MRRPLPESPIVATTPLLLRSRGAGGHITPQPSSTLPAGAGLTPTSRSTAGRRRQRRQQRAPPSIAGNRHLSLAVTRLVTTSDRWRVTSCRTSGPVVLYQR